MKIIIILLLILTSFVACENTNQSDQEVESKTLISIESNPCDYIKDYEGLGNRIIDTIKIGNRLIDPIDDLSNFTKTDFGLDHSSSYQTVCRPNIQPTETNTREFFPKVG